MRVLTGVVFRGLGLTVWVSEFGSVGDLTACRFAVHGAHSGEVKEDSTLVGSCHYNFPKPKS